MRKLHVGVEAETGQIMATELTNHDIDDGSRVGPLLDQIAARLLRVLVTGRTTGTMSATRLPSVIRRPRLLCRHVRPPCRARLRTWRRRSATNIFSKSLTKRGHMGWQKNSGYNRRALVEAAVGRYKRVIGDALRSRTHRHQVTEAAIAVNALNRMLEFGRLKSVRIA